MTILTSSSLPKPLQTERFMSLLTAMLGTRSKKRSFAKERRNVGVLNPSAVRVLLGKTYLKNHPEMEGKFYYYENNKLVESFTEIEESVSEEKKPDTAYLDDILCWGTSYACLKSLKELGIKKSLDQVFGGKDAAALMQLAPLPILGRGAYRKFQEWAPVVWLPGSGRLTSQRISEVLSGVDQAKMTQYFKLRFDSANQADEYRFLALDSTTISSYSETREEAYGHAKQNSELK